MGLAELKSELRRRMILDALEKDPNYSITLIVLRGHLKDIGHATTDTSKDIVWLEEKGLITTDVAGGLVAATITPLGEDVACGHKSFEGVRRHRSGE